MDQDETPTPKQSGSYAMMQNICVETLRSLEAWRASSVKAQQWNRLGQIELFQERFGSLLEAVKSWATDPPDAPVKARTIEGILRARTEATDLGARWGLAL